MAGRDPSQTAESSDKPLGRQPQDVGSLRALLYALLLAIFCLHIFKLSNNKWRKPPEESRRRSPIKDTISQDRAQSRAIKMPSDDPLYQITGLRGKISSLVFLLDGKHVVCACREDGMVQICDIDDRTEPREPRVLNLGVAVNVAILSRDGNLIVTGNVDGKMVVWDTGFRHRCEAAEPHGGMITALDVLSSLHIASGSNNGTVLLWSTGVEPGSPLVPAHRLVHHDSVAVASVKFSLTGLRIASACAHWGCSIRIWHTRTGEQVFSIRIDGSPICSLAWSNDGRRLFAGCSNGSISCYDMVTRKLFCKAVEPRPGDDAISSLCLSNSDQFLISFSAPGRMVDIWDIRNPPSHKPVRSFSRCISASMSSDGLYLVSSADDTISIRGLSRVVEESCFFHCFAPFTYVSPAAYRAWTLGELEQAEYILTREIEDKQHQSFECYSRANRALVRIRQGNLKGALDDVEGITTDGLPIPLMIHIAKAMTFITQGKRRQAIDAFGSAHHGDAKRFVECVKSIILFELELRDKPSRGTEVAEFHSLADSPCAWVKARKLLLLADQYIWRGEYDEGLQLLAKVPDLGPCLHVPEAKIITLVFGWDMYDLESMVQQLICQALFASERTQEVMNFLRLRENPFDEEHEIRKADLGWFVERLGDESLGRGKYDDAITWYSMSLDLYPESRVGDCGSEYAKRCLLAIHVTHTAVDVAIMKDLAFMAHYPPGTARLLLKRSRARLSRELWHDALEDANLVIRMDGMCLWGYERKHTALRALCRYAEATKTLEQMVIKMDDSADPSTRLLQTQYIAPDEVVKKIEEQISVICETSPLVLIHVKTGKLCDAVKRTETFKSDPIFHELVSFMSTELDIIRIKKIVARYFRYVMFSHTWEGKEPTFQDLSGSSVYELDSRPLNIKLRRFCDTAQDDPEGYLWAWSDTCCIDKTIETVYRRSIRSMYSWYKESALTIVLLAHGSTTLKNNRWMTRAWTLQELLSPKSIRFYNRDWDLYGGDSHPNHKESPNIMQELAEAVCIAHDTLVHFSPESLGIRAKLRLASTREATEKVDIAYALIGIFSSDLIPEYRDPEDALGLLLQEVVHRERDAKAVLDWVGKSSQFNSCLPSQISSYQDSPFAPPPIPEDVMEDRVAELRSVFLQQDVIMFFGRLSSLGSIDFTHRRLSLPCITFSVSVDTPRHKETSTSSGGSTIYRAHATALGQFEFETSSTVFWAQDEVVLVYPWIRDLLAQASLPGVDSYTRALRLIVYLEQPFRALLLVKQSVDTYRRVAADTEILVPKRKMMTLKDLSTKVLEIR